MTGASRLSFAVVSRSSSLRGMLIALGRCSSSYSSRGSTSTSCAPSSTSLRTSSLKIAVGTGPSRHQRLPEHLRCRGTPQTLRSCVYPTSQPPVLTLRDRKQVLPVYPYRGAAGEAKPLGLVVAVHRDELNLGLQPLLRQDCLQGLRRRLIGRTPVEVKDLDLHPPYLLTLTPRGVECSSRVLPEHHRPCSPSLWAVAARHSMWPRDRRAGRRPTRGVLRPPPLRRTPDSRGASHPTGGSP